MDWHRPRIDALLQAGVDLLAMETIPAQVYLQCHLEKPLLADQELIT